MEMFTVQLSRTPQLPNVRLVDGMIVGNLGGVTLSHKERVQLDSQEQIRRGQSTYVKFGHFSVKSLYAHHF